MPANRTNSESKIVRLAGLDWALAPVGVIRSELKVTYGTLSEWRKTDLYRQSVEELKKEWREQMLNLPGTNEIRKTIAYALGIGTRKCVEILANPRSQPKDIISATRLIALMDGRFVHNDTPDSDDPRNLDDAKAVSAELQTVLNRLNSSRPQ